MITGLSDAYKELMGQPGTTVNCTVEVQTGAVSSMTLGMDRIFDLRIYSLLFSEDTLSIGGTASKCLKCTFLPNANTIIPRMAKIWLRYNLRGASGTTSGTRKLLGPFYIDTRSVDTATGKMTVTAYDVMLMAEQTIDLRSTSSPVISHTDAVSAIALKLGVTLDTRSPALMSANFTRSATLTMRQILSRIAVLNCGNWVITYQNMLRFIPISGAATDNCDMGNNARSLSVGARLGAITKLTVQLVEDSTDEDDLIIIGDSSGRSMTVFCPWCTEAIASTIFTKLKSASAAYIPFEAEGALIDLAYEVGDTLTWGSDKTTKYLLASQTVTMGRVPYSTLSAPGEKAIDHECPYKNAR